MPHVLYALFDSDTQAAAALAEAVEAGIPREHFSVVMHDRGGAETEELSVAESGARGGVVSGAVLGALAGVLTMGVLVVPFGGLLGAGALATAALGASTGGAFGALAAGLAGLGVPDHQIEPLLDQVGDGRVLVTIQVEQRDEERLLEDAFARHGAVQARKRGG